MSDTTTDKPAKRSPDQIYAEIIDVRREDLGTDPTDLNATLDRTTREATLWDEMAATTVGRSTVPPWARETLTITRRAIHDHADRLKTAAKTTSA